MVKFAQMQEQSNCNLSSVKEKSQNIAKVSFTDPTPRDAILS